MTLGQRIQKIRKEKGFSQEEIAEALGVSRQAVSKWENGISSPDTENLIALAALLGVDISELVSEPEGKASVEENNSQEKRNIPWTKIVLVISLIFAVLFFSLWQAECVREEKLELLCLASASSCLDSLCSYEETGKEMHFLSAVSEFRAFMQAYHLLTEDTGKHGNYTYLNEAYGYMLCGREKIDANLPLLIKAMGQLSHDIHDHSGHNLMYDLYIALRHG